MNAVPQLAPSLETVIVPLCNPTIGFTAQQSLPDATDLTTRLWCDLPESIKQER
ncbi:hypothetical protein [Paraburkholderia hospita]|uniref:hypothetical protein n=1 Tax=Paraburkholderia hospita TaxID=169430 RepID=UPI0013FD85FC|nr:hypothetical protein [Paraburkholderia hospita]